MIPSPADLAYFAEIAQTLNLSRAAERLGVSQPSLSLAIRRLEDSIGAPLFIRSKRGVSLTQAGLQLLAHTRQMLQSWEHVRGRALASMHMVEGSYRIGCHASVALQSLPGFLPQLLAAHPALHIDLRHDLSRKVAEDVISLKVDIGIVVNPVRHPDLVIHKLCKDQMTFWRSAGRLKPLQDIKSGQAILICNPELRQAQELLKQLERRSIRFARTITSNSLQVITDLAGSGCGIGILPAQAAAIARKKLTALPDMPVFYDDHCLIYRIENKGVKAVQVIASAIRDFYHERYGKEALAVNS